MKEKWDACIDCGCVKINLQRRYSRCRFCTAKEVQNRPEVKAKKSAASREVCNRPEVKAKKSASQREAQNRPEVKAKKSVSAREAQNRPEVKARHCAAMKEALNRTEVRIKQSIRRGGDGDLERIDRERTRCRRFEEYKSSPRRQWSQSVKERDRHTCQRCGETNKKILHAHHIKPKAMFPELGLEIDNGLTLCQPCHLAEHRRMRLESYPLE